MGKVTLEDGLVERARRCAEQAGYASVEELVAHAVERLVRELEQPPDAAALERRLRGLGYIE